MLGIVWHVLVGEDGHIDAEVCANSKFIEPVYDESRDHCRSNTYHNQMFDGPLGMTGHKGVVQPVR